MSQSCVFRFSSSLTQPPDANLDRLRCLALAESSIEKPRSQGSELSCLILRQAHFLNDVERILPGIFDFGGEEPEKQATEEQTMVRKVVHWAKQAPLFDRYRHVCDNEH